MKKQNIAVYVPFTKSDDAERTVSGYCTSESLDSQGEIILKDAIVKAWDKYMEYGNIREMHQASAVGVTKEYMHDENGTFITVKVVDDRAWKFVQEGVYKGFSIGGRVLKKNKNIIEAIILSEISLVDRPANPDAKFSISKVDDGLVDQLQEEANQEKDMKKSIEIDGVKYQENPEKPGEALIDETTGEKVLFVEEEEVEEEVVEEEEKKEEEVEEEKVEEEEKKEEEVEEGEKSDKPDFVKKAETAGVLSKDTDGVIMLADLLSHLEYVMACFSQDEKDVSSLAPIKDALMAAVQAESSETIEAGAKTADLRKMMGSEFAKAMEPIMEKMGTFEKSFDELKKDVEAIKSTKVSPRPAGAARTVEKSIPKAGDNAGDKTLVEKQKAVADIEEEINEFAKVEGQKVKNDPSLSASFMAKSAELHTKLSNAKHELSLAFSGE